MDTKSGFLQIKISHNRIISKVVFFLVHITFVATFSDSPSPSDFICFYFDLLHPFLYVLSYEKQSLMKH